MALFGSKTCSLCGMEFKGLGLSCGDGVLCKDCERSVLKVIPLDDAMAMRVSTIRMKLKQNADLLDAPPKPVPETCPICGKKLRALNRSEIRDTYICTSCFFKARDMIPHADTDQIEKKKLSALLPLFEKPAGGWANAIDRDALRILYPLVHTLAEVPGEEGFDHVYLDPLDELSAEELQAAQSRADTEREARAARYGPHKAVFQVDDIQKSSYYSKGLHYRDEHEVTGRVLLGEIAAGDTVQVVRSEKTYAVKVKALGTPAGRKPEKAVREGCEGILILPGDVPYIYPGDVLTVG